MNSEHKRAIADALEEGLKESGHVMLPSERKVVEMAIDLTVKTMEKIKEIQSD